MNDIKFLLKELFTQHTREGKLPETLQDFEVYFSQKEYEVILKEVMTAVGCFEDK